MRRFFKSPEAKGIKPLKSLLAMITGVVLGIFLSESAAATSDLTASEIGGIISYREYSEKYDSIQEAKSEIIINASNYYGVQADPETGETPVLTTGDFDGVEKCLFWHNNAGMVTYMFECEEGLYSFDILYRTVTEPDSVTGIKPHTEIEIGIMIDGEYPFSAAKSVPLTRLWKDETGIERDSEGNDLRPLQITYDSWISYSPKDGAGLSNEPYMFYLSKGIHTVTIRGIEALAVYKSFSFKPRETPVLYDEIKPSDDRLWATPPLTTRNEMGSYTIFLQGERASSKTTPLLCATSDGKSYLVSPSHPVKRRFNTIGADTWNKAGQAVSWEFNVPNDGYYAVSVRVKQSEKLNLSSYRRVYIDGIVPCAEFTTQEFPYNSGWYSKVLSDFNNEPVYLFIEAGKHTLTFEAVFGGLDDIRSQPLELDYIEIGTVYEKFIDKKPNFIEQFFFDFNVFVASYFKGFEPCAESGEALDVWVLGNRDTAAVIEKLNTADYVSVTAKDALVEAVMAGHMPDAAVFCTDSDAALFASRGLLADLSAFDDFAEVFAENYGDMHVNGNKPVQTYTMPVSVNYPLIFYRTDIFDELALSPPSSWDEFTELAAVLRLNGMKPGLESPRANSGSSFGSDHVFAIMLLQSGCGLYTDDLSKTALDTPEAAECFQKWTELYALYDIDVNADLSAGFISGAIPVVLRDISFYDKLTVNAPEINGMWNVAPVPGTTAVAEVRSAVIFNNTFDKETAWEFVKWFASEETQVQIGKTGLALFGKNMFYPASSSAFGQLPLIYGDTDIMTEQKRSSVRIPTVLSIFPAAQVTAAAFYSVTEKEETPVRALKNAANKANGGLLGGGFYG